MSADSLISPRKFDVLKTNTCQSNEALGGGGGGYASNF